MNHLVKNSRPQLLPYAFFSSLLSHFLKSECHEKHLLCGYLPSHQFSSLKACVTAVSLATRLNPGTIHVGFMVNKIALGRIFHIELRLPVLTMRHSRTLFSELIRGQSNTGQNLTRLQE
jgi:hypothetical protein